MSGNLMGSNTELRFGQLEIPVNLKVNVLQRKSSGIYVLSGISNMFLINQRSITNFDVANFGGFTGSANQNLIQSFSQTIRPDNLSNEETMGQLFNFGFGYEHNLSNGTYLSIEPFYKTSIGSQTFLGQQFSIGGINLRMNFQLKK